MMKIGLLKEDHQHLLSICQNVETASLSVNNTADIDSILRLLRKFMANLDAHLICEDKYLYPYLINHDQSEVSQTADRFKHEMGGLYETVTQYVKQWNTDTAAASISTFVDTLRDLIETIRTRIRKEETVLFPMMTT